MFKKYTAAMLALVMVMALALPWASADSISTMSDATFSNAVNSSTQTSSPSGGEVSQGIVTGTGIANPTMNITFLGSGAVILNPFKLTVKLADGMLDDSGAYSGVATALTGTGSSDSVVGVPIIVKNESQVKVTATVKASVTIPATNKSFTYSAAPLTGKETGKKMFLYMELVTGDNTTVAKPTAYAAKATDAGYDNQVAFAVGTAAKDKALKAEIPVYTDTDQKYGFFRIGGECTKDSTWDSKDTFTTSLAFKFLPVSY